METVATTPERIERGASAPIDRVELDDGRSVIVRPVLPRDAQAEQAFLAGLSAATRRRRFHLAVNELPPALLREFTEVDQFSHVALVAATVGADGAPALVADARYVIDGARARADFAVAVADAWQGIGLGEALLRRLLQQARRSGIRRLGGDVQVDNDPMLRLARKLGARIHRVPGDAGTRRACFLL